MQMARNNVAQQNAPQNARAVMRAHSMPSAKVFCALSKNGAFGGGPLAT